MSHMNSYTYEYIVHPFATNESWHVRVSQVWFMSHMNESKKHMNESCHTYERVMSHIWMSHVTLMNESSHTYKRVTSHIRMSHITHMNESCHTCQWSFHTEHLLADKAGERLKLIRVETYEWVMSHIWPSHVTHMTESFHMYQHVMSHIWIRDFTQCTFLPTKRASDSNSSASKHVANRTFKLRARTDMCASTSGASVGDLFCKSTAVDLNITF